MLINRDISWQEFNFRVLQEAMDKSVPLYERIKFLAIFSSNLDEFFRVRYPSVVALSKLDKINRQLSIFGVTLEDEIIPALEDNGIIFYYSTTIRTEHIAEIKELFLS